MVEHSDLVIRRLMRNLRILAGCDALLTALEGGQIVAELMALTARCAEETAEDARRMLLMLRQGKGADPRSGH